MVTQILWLMFLGTSFGLPANKLIELSYTHDKLVPNWPNNLRLEISETLEKGPTEDLKWLYMNNFCSSEHTGTHMDSPSHFYQDGKTIDLISYENLYRINGIRVNLTEKSSKNLDYAVQASDLDEWVAKNGELPDGVVVLFDFGVGKVAFDEAKYLGIDENGGYHWPVIGKSGAEWLVNYGRNHNQTRGVLGVGVDAVSLEGYGVKEFPAHLTILGEGLFGIESMMNLDKLPARNFTLTMFPIKIGGGSGGPTRVLAEIDGKPFE